MFYFCHVLCGRGLRASKGRRRRARRRSVGRELEPATDEDVNCMANPRRSLAEVKWEVKLGLITAGSSVQSSTRNFKIVGPLTGQNVLF